DNDSEGRAEQIVIVVVVVVAVDTHDINIARGRSASGARPLRCELKFSMFGYACGLAGMKVTPFALCPA
ncbi:MAG: hypothetical protein ACOCUB_00520, partial [Desulfohalobiaceae bacterium]